MMLVPLIINGKIRHKVYLREKAFGKLENEYKREIEVKKLGKQTPQVVSYSMAGKWEEWMKESALYLTESNCAGCGKAAIRSERLLADRPTLEFIQPEILYKPKPLFSFVIPPADSAKIGQRQGSAYLKFRVGKSAIDTLNKNNVAELEKIHATLNKILDDENITIKSISITGFASIEGSYESNKRLSEQRAKALHTYIQQYYNLPYDLFRVDWVGEDWDGLISLIENGDMAQKNEVLAIINGADVFDGRENQLMHLDRGRPYRFMLDQYFPLLRRVNYLIEYNIREFTLEESKSIIKNNPDQLSRRELFLLAETYDKDSQQFLDLMAIALKLYPQDAITNHNAAAAYAMHEKYEQAEYFALHSGNSAAALNNLGAIYLLQGKLEDAEETLLKAQEAGSKDALWNLNELGKIK